MTLSQLRLGTAPDSWGVWHPDDPVQVPWHRFLDEVAVAGYAWVELGPYGYLPTDAARLRDELDARGLAASGQAEFAALHRPAAFDDALTRIRRVVELLVAVGARHFVYLPELYRDDISGRRLEPYDLEPERWKDLVTGVSRLGRILADEYGVTLVFHPHADSHVDTQERVERFLDDTDPDTVSVCLDVGHVAYCGGDNLALIGKYPERIGYVHLKQADPEIVRQVGTEGLSFAEAVRRGAMVEPPAGIPQMPPVLAALGGLDRDLFAIVEQDLYPCAPDVPLPIAMRTRQYFNQCGLRPDPRET
ncbi:MAG TPA: sugar phosphate isomerase/epimerase [Planosporangium sp.]|jgi:inosose dehydratase|nr:sugar phosphate isomerase/epimerase [Planosporangium sp.]